VLGHQIAKGGCRTSRHADYRRGHTRYASRYDRHSTDYRADRRY
jgi:hypothetical protein